jgi:hypothetical protein
MTETGFDRPNTLMPVLRYALLLSLTTAVAIAGGFLWLVPNGLMAGAMASCYTLATIWLAERQRRVPGSVGEPEALAAGLLSGMLAIAPVMLLELTRPQPHLAFRESDFLRPPDLDNWYLITASILYGVALHWSYQRRRAGKSLLRVTITACLACSAVRLLLFGLGDGASIFFPGFGISDLFRLLMAAFMLCLFSPVPFAAAWTLLTWWLDPSFSGVGDRASPETPVISQQTNL